MIDIYSFIDSKDIREYNRKLGTKFTPIEQAVIIYHCDSKTVEEKLAAWYELLETYTEEKFEKINLPDGGRVTNRNIMFGDTYRQKLEITVNGFEKALQLKNDMEGMLYIVRVYANADSDDYEEAEFSTFGKAYEYICTSKERELLDYGTSAASTMHYSMRAVTLDEDDYESTDFIFDNDFRMTQIYFHYNDEKYGIDYVYVYVPLPFKKGDIIRTIDGRNKFAIVPKTPDESYFIHAYDSTAMHITAWCISERNGEIVDDFAHFNIFDIGLCTEDDLPLDSCYFSREKFLALRDKE